jgi:hypothetical protein
LPGFERCFKNTGAKELNEIMHILKEKFGSTWFNLIQLDSIHPNMTLLDPI